MLEEWFTQVFVWVDETAFFKVINRQIINSSKKISIYIAPISPQFYRSLHFYFVCPA